MFEDNKNNNMLKVVVKVVLCVSLGGYFHIYQGHHRHNLIKHY